MALAHSRTSCCGENACEPTMAILLFAAWLHTAPACGTTGSACAIPAAIPGANPTAMIVVAAATRLFMTADGSPPAAAAEPVSAKNVG